MQTKARDATWLLLALENRGREGRLCLSDIIGRADAINHDVMSFQGFKRGLDVLISIGLVADPQRRELTAAARSLLKASGRRTWHERWARIESAIERRLAEGGGTSVISTTVTEQAFNDAVREYLARHGLPRP